MMMSRMNQKLIQNDDLDLIRTTSSTSLSTIGKKRSSRWDSKLAD